ncbi:protein mono-ADP-ribosyltransferase PARP14-like [Scyliorhinus canicula]|uniref:protein mono-ADP-ribosyltransferase PARP14-like n=1 Tax=Scyliorhinus canicula TaxID=7830 RepID=UPI0018F395F7|nr:protein mono-ADP-ribosyltransferase PARP14-like [Scyliorhinus canicula]
MRLDADTDSILLVPASRGTSGEVSAGWGEGAERTFRRFQERHPVRGEDEPGKFADRPEAGGEAREVARLDRPSKFSVIWPSFNEELASCFPGLEWTLDESCTSITFSGRPTFVREAMSNLNTRMDQVLEQPLHLSDEKRAFLASWAPGDLAKELFSFPVALELADGRATLLGNSWPELNRAKSILTSRIVQEEVDVHCDVPDWLQWRRPFPDELTNKVQVVEGRDKRGGTSKICIVGFEEEAKSAARAEREHLRDSAETVESIEPEQQALVPHVHRILELMGCQGLQSTVSTRGKRRIVLTGPKSIVGDEKVRLKSCLASVVWDSFTVAEPGAREFFQGRGEECLAAVAQSTKCLVVVQDEASPEPEDGGQSASPGSRTLSSYLAGDTLTVTVCQGDITQQRVDAIVNAANGRLQHGAGVAGAIARAGGPKIEEESAALVKKQGRVPVGQAVMTGAGRLPCSKVIHAVGPEWRLREEIGEAGVKDRLRSAIAASLELAENAGCASMAVPCLSSGIFGVPKAICASAIVAAIKGFRGSSLRNIALIDINGDVLSELEKACGLAWPPPGSSDQSPPAQAAPATTLQLEIISGLIEDQESDVLVVPIARDMDPYSTAVSKAIFNKALIQESARWKVNTVRGGMVRELDVSTNPRLNCKYIYFVHPDASSRFQSSPEQIRACIEHCAKSSFSSITFPAFGGPKEATARALLNEIQRFKENSQPSSIKRIQITIPPFDTSRNKIYRQTQQELEAGLSSGRSVGSDGPYHSASFSGTLARVNIGNIVLQIANADITKETADVIVNSTSNTPPNFGNENLIAGKDLIKIDAGKIKIMKPIDNTEEVWVKLQTKTAGKIISEAVKCKHKIVQNLDKHTFESEKHGVRRKINYITIKTHEQFGGKAVN